MWWSSGDDDKIEIIYMYIYEIGMWKKVAAAQTKSRMSILSNLECENHKAATTTGNILSL